MIGVYFHLYAAGAWETPTDEFLDAFIDSGLAEESPLYLGVVGSLAQRDEAYRVCAGRVAAIRVVAEADEGWEQLTLEALHRDPVGDHILYCHTKGAAVVDDWNAAWRRSMYLSLVTEWRDCLPWLEEYETVGCHWLTNGPCPTPFPFWGGNCWWARRSLIERLPEPQMTTRYDAEAWIGSVPNVTYHDLRPGWPGWETIRQEARHPRRSLSFG